MRPFRIRKYTIAALALCLSVLHLFADPPVASNVAIPAGPFLPGQTINATYDYSDPENDDELGSVYEWYESNSPTGSSPSIIISGSLSFLVTSGYRGKYIAFQVTPGDTEPLFGTPVFSNWELVNSLPQAIDDNYIDLSNEGEDLIRSAANGVLDNDIENDAGQSLVASLVDDVAHGILSLSLPTGLMTEQKTVILRQCIYRFWL